MTDEVDAQWDHREEGHVVAGAVLDRLKVRNVEFQRAVREVLGHWLISNDQEKVDWALTLVSLLRATEHIEALERLHKDVRSGRSSLSQKRLDREYYLDVLPRMIVSLMKERGENWCRLAKYWLRFRLLPATEEALNRLAQR